MKKRYDSDKDITEKLNKLMWQSEREAKKAVTKASKVYQQNLIANTPVDANSKHTHHAKDVTKISNFQRDNLRPTKEVGYDKGKSRADGGWYIHFPDIGTQVRGTVGQPPQHFLRKTHEMSKAPILDIYTKALEDMLDID